MLTAQIMPKEEFEAQQTVELYREKANRASLLWDEALNELSTVNHKWKWDYMDYLEVIKCKDAAEVTLDDTMLEPQATVVPEETTTEMQEPITEEKEVVAEIIDYTKLSLEERASRLPVPTDDYAAEYDAHRQRMGYTAERMNSIRYKMRVYDEYREEYDYRKHYYGVEVVKTMERCREKEARKLLLSLLVNIKLYNIR